MIGLCNLKNVRNEAFPHTLSEKRPIQDEYAEGVHVATRAV